MYYNLCIYHIPYIYIHIYIIYILIFKLYSSFTFLMFRTNVCLSVFVKWMLRESGLAKGPGIPDRSASTSYFDVSLYTIKYIPYMLY